jgi:hypothetical protein
MMIALNILMIALLFWIFYEDLKDRKITLVWMLSLIVLGGFLNFEKQIFEVFLINTLLNIITVFFVIAILWIYSRMKIKKQLFQLFGTGDLLFFIFMAVSFPTTTFLVLFSASLIFSLLLSTLLKKRLTKWVPLAGLQALFLGLIFGVNHVFNFVNLYAV